MNNSIKENIKIVYEKYAKEFDEKISFADDNNWVDLIKQDSTAN